MFCWKCGNANPNDAAYCNRCGSELRHVESASPEKREAVARLAGTLRLVLAAMKARKGDEEHRSVSGSGILSASSLQEAGHPTQVRFKDSHRMYFKPPLKPLKEYGELAWWGLLEYSELSLVAKTQGIAQEFRDWWSPISKSNSQIRMILLATESGFVPDYPMRDCIDAIFTNYENGAEVIKGTGWVYVIEPYRHKDQSFPEMDVNGAGLPDEISQALVSIDYQKKLSSADWKYYKDLMHQNPRTLKFFHEYQEREEAERAESQADARKKVGRSLIWAVVCVIAYVFFWSKEFYDSQIFAWACLLLLLPAANFLARLFGYFWRKRSRST